MFIIKMYNPNTEYIIEIIWYHKSHFSWIKYYRFSGSWFCAFYHTFIWKCYFISRIHSFMEGVNLWMRVTYKFQKNLPSSNFNDSRVVTVSHKKNFNVNYTLYMIYLFPFANMILNKELEWKLNVEKKNHATLQTRRDCKKCKHKIFYHAKKVNSYISCPCDTTGCNSFRTCTINDSENFKCQIITVYGIKLRKTNMASFIQLFIRHLQCTNRWTTDSKRSGKFTLN